MLLRADWLYGKCGTNALFSLFKLLYHTEVNKKYKILDFIKMRALFISYSVAHQYVSIILALFFLSRVIFSMRVVVQTSGDLTSFLKFTLLLLCIFFYACITINLLN